jgi:hypothetical protein
VQHGQCNFDIDMSRLWQRQGQFSASPEHVPTDHSPGLGDQRTESTPRVGRPVIAPQRVDQRASRDRLQPRKCQVREEQPALTSWQYVVDPSTQQIHGKGAAQRHPDQCVHRLSIAHWAYLG